MDARLFGTDSKQSEDHKGSISNLPRRVYSFVNENRTALLYGGLGSVTFYGITRVMYDVTYQFLALTPATSLYYGFVGGSISTTIFGSFILAAYGTLSMHPSSSYHVAAKIARNDAELKRHLGVTAGQRLAIDQLKTYVSQSGGVNLSSMAINSPQMFVMFKVYEKKRANTYALVYAHCSKHRYQPSYMVCIFVNSYDLFFFRFTEKMEFLGADIFDGSKRRARHVLRGHEDGFDKFDDLLN